MTEGVGTNGRIVPTSRSGPSVRGRLLAWLGFGPARSPLPQEDECPDGVLLTHITISLDWRERLRMLVSGKGHVEMVMWADRTRQMRSMNAFRVLPPGHTLPG